MNGGAYCFIVDGKLIDQCYIPGLFKLIDSHGIKKIWGLKVSFKTEEFAKKYNEWLSNLINTGTTFEAKEFIAKKNASQNARRHISSVSI